VHGVNQESTNSSLSCDHPGSHHCVFEQRASQPVTLMIGMDRKTCEQHDRDGIAPKAFLHTIRCILELDRTGREGVVADNGFIRLDDERAGRARLLTGQREALQPLLKLRLAAGEVVEMVARR